MAKALTQNETIREKIGVVQEDLLVLGAGLACESSEACKYLLGPDQVLRLEKWIDQLQEEVPLPRCFICPGANVVGAALDLARTIVRRSERRVMALREAEQWVDDEVHAYLNRLADFLFTLARYAEKRG